MLKFPFLVSMVVIAAIFDLRWRRIPNWLTAFGWSFGVMLQGIDAGWNGVWDAFLGTGVALAIYVTLFALRAMGGGDVKLMAAVGAFTGPVQWFSVFLLAALVGGVFALVAVWTRGEATRAMSKIGTILWELVHLRAPHTADPELDVANAGARTLPHGAAIAAGTILLLIYNSSR
jgi:prepilin peptidase CpaA